MTAGRRRAHDRRRAATRRRWPTCRTFALHALADGTVPLAVWLRNAAALTAARPEARVFHAALDELRSGGQPSAASPSAALLLPDGRPCGAGAAGKPPINSPGLGRSARVFISYSHADDAHRKRLDVHLAPLKREGLIAPWHDRMLLPGTLWDAEIDRFLAEADVVLLLVSADFVASDYCFKREMGFALDLHRRGKMQIIPIVVEPTDFGKMPFAQFQGLPRDAKPVSLWSSTDEAWLDVAKGIRRVVETLGATPIALGTAGHPLLRLPHLRERLRPGPPSRRTFGQLRFRAEFKNISTKLLKRGIEKQSRLVPASRSLRPRAPTKASCRSSAMTSTSADSSAIRTRVTGSESELWQATRTYR
ncbi:MAG: toll/interleukin-1 receptor domain-containing protein [Myxococcales bacterium]|nr:toll/interleukin-1 receptor domain-containing protein [Myxococcales bacterium]